MGSLNRIQVIGNLGSDAEMKFSPSGNPNTTFKLATNRRYTDSEGAEVKETEWFRVVTWGKLAEQCNKFLSKGRFVYVEGRLHLHNWDGTDGERHYMNEITANSVEFLDTKKKEDMDNGDKGYASVQLA